LVLFSPHYLSRVVRRLYWLRDRDPVDEELRGWAWDRFPVKPRAYFGLGVSEVASRPCATSRTSWLRRTAGARGGVEKGSPIWWGRVVHELIDAAARDVRELLVDGGMGPHRVYEELSARAWRRAREAGAPDRRAVEFYRSMVMLFTSQYLASTAVRWGPSAGGLPFPTEHRVDGSPLGLSNQLRVDALGESNIVVEFKYGRNDRGRHAVGVAGYALALESELEVPVDFGIIVYISDVGATPKMRMEPVYVDNMLRREFLENRDEVIDVLMRSSPPPKPSSCSASCPLYRVCWPSPQGRAGSARASDKAGGPGVLTTLVEGDGVESVG